MNRVRLNLVMLGVVAALLATALYFHNKADKKKPPLTGLKGDAVSHLVLDKAGGRKIDLVRSAGRWKFTSPVAVDADPNEVKSLTGVAETPDEQTIPAAEVKLSELGLDPPQYTLSLDNVTLRFGGTEPIRYRRYVLLNGEVHLIADPPSAAFSGDWANLVSKTLVPAGATLRRIEVPGLSVARTADDQPWVATPAQPGAPADAAKAFADAWGNARAMWNVLVPADKPAAGDAVRLVLSDGRALDFLVSARDPQLNLTRADLGLTYVLSKDDENKLLRLTAPKATGGATPPAPSASVRLPGLGQLPH